MQTTSSVGYLVGFIVGSFLLSHFSRFFVLVLGSATLGLTLTFVPWTTSSGGLNAAYAIVGSTLAILMVGGNVICLDYWGRRAGPYMQTLHFCLSLGLLTGPLLIEPLSRTQIPSLVKSALPANLLTNASSDADIAATALPPSPKYDISLRKKRAVDPLLMELLGTKSSRKEKEPKRKKPSFTDGMKLDHSRDWDKVKMSNPPLQEVMAPAHDDDKEEDAKTKEAHDNDGPSIEDIFRSLSIAPLPSRSTMTKTTKMTTTTTTTKSPMLRQIEEEMKALEKDMERSGKLIKMLKSQQKAAVEEPRLKRRAKRGIRNRNPTGFDPTYGQRRFPKPNRYPSQDPGKAGMRIFYLGTIRRQFF